MNTHFISHNLKTALIRRTSEQGFAIPVALGLGLVMLLVGATMIVRSQGDNATASAQKETSRSMSIAEVGVTRVQDLINKLRVLSTTSDRATPTNLKPWMDARSNLTGLPSCVNTDYLNSIDVAKYIDTTNSTNQPGKWVPVTNGRFRIISYKYDSSVPPSSQLKIEAETTNNSSFPSKSILQVTIPVKNSDDVPVPGLWARNVTNLGGNQINGNVQIQGCATATNGVITNNNGTTSPNLSSNVINGQIVANPISPLPVLPNLPGAASGGTVCPTPIINQRQTVMCYYSIPAINGSNTPLLPRAGDTAASDGNYYYLVNNNASQGSSLELSINSPTTTVTTRNLTGNYKVVLFLKGNVLMSGNALISHPPTITVGGTTLTQTPTNFQIFGSDGTVNKYCTSTPFCTTSTIQLAGGGTLYGFIFAPNATVGSNGCGGGGACVVGSIWVDTFNPTSSTSNLVITQTATWDAFANLSRPWQSIFPVSSWQRQGS